jgi:hypothetical protein
MTTTLDEIRTKARRSLRDPIGTDGSATFSEDELADMIGQGIEEIGGFYPQEVMGEVTISASVYSYALPSGLDDPFRVDIIDDSDNVAMVPRSDGNGPNGGWELFGGVMYFPVTTLNNGVTLRVWGYGPWAYIDSSSASSDTTDLDQAGLEALNVFVQVEGFNRLTVDRTKFLQWRKAPENYDTSSSAFYYLARQVEDRWSKQKARLFRVRRRV